VSTLSVDNEVVGASTLQAPISCSTGPARGGTSDAEQPHLQSRTFASSGARYRPGSETLVDAGVSRKGEMRANFARSGVDRRMPPRYTARTKTRSSDQLDYVSWARLRRIGVASRLSESGGLFWCSRLDSRRRSSRQGPRKLARLHGLPR